MSLLDEIDPDQYMGRLRATAHRAASPQKRHAQNRTPFPKDNPSSTMHEFLAAIES